MTIGGILSKAAGARRVYERALRRAMGREEVMQWAAGAMCFALGFTFSRASVFGGYKPFSVGLTAAAGGGVNGLIVLVGVVLGHITGDPFDWAMKYIAVAGLVFAASRILRDTGLTEKTWYAPLSAAVFIGVIGFVYISDSGWSYHRALRQWGEVALAAMSALSFRVGFLEEHKKERLRDSVITVSKLSYLAAVCIALEGTRIMGMISPGRIIVTAFLMLASCRSGGSIACALGLAFGMAMDAGTGYGTFYTVTLGSAGLITGRVGEYGRLASAITFVLVCTGFVLWRDESPAILYESFIGGTVFLLLPEYAAARVRALFPVQVTGSGAIRAREYTKTRVEQMALAFSELYDSVRTVPTEKETKSEAAAVFDRAAESVCRACPDFTRCWERETERTLGVMETLAPRMLSRGSVSESDFPLSFSQTCGCLPELVSAINQELRVMLFRRQYTSRLREKRGAVYNQYADISSVLRSLAGELGSELTFEPELEGKLKRYLAGLNIDANAAVFRDRGGRLRAEIYGDGAADVRKDGEYLEKLSALLGTRLCTGKRKNDDRVLLLEAEPLSVSVGLAAMKKRGQPTSGDRGTYFKTEDGILYIILSDGMGTGEAAARCSESAVRVLERFLRAGVPPETAMRILNDLMLLKNETDTVSATVDMMCVDLFYGDTRLYKFGAAPSYIRRGGTVKRLSCHSLSTGLGFISGESPDYVRMKLLPGTFAVIISDGVTAGDDDEWLKLLIASYSGTSPRELAKRILSAANTRTDTDDDKTALVIYIENRP